MASEIISGRPVWVGGYEFSNKMNTVALDHGADDIDATTLADSTHVHKAGLKSSGFSMEGFFDEVIDEQLFGNLSLEDVPVAIAAQQGNAGEVAYFFKTIQGEYQHGGSVGELHTFTAGGNARGDLVRGSIHINGAVSTSSATSGIQSGAVASGEKVRAALFVTAASGTSPTLDVVVESDDNGAFSTATSRITFAQATGVGAEILELDGPITDDYWRINYTLGGTGPGFTFMVVVGIQ